MYRHFFFITCFLFSTPSFAVEAIQFSVTPDKRTLRFEATQNGAVVSGTFTHFNADIAFHPENLSESAVTVVIDTQNIAMSYAEAANTLPEEEWFNSESFPSATLKTQSFTKIDETHFTADAILTIKEYNAPLTLEFELHEFSSEQAHVTGHATLNRLDYHIGWKDTDSIANKVTVHFSLYATAE